MTAIAPLAQIIWVRIGAGRCAHILAEYGTAARSVAKCGKVGKVTLLCGPVSGSITCDRCEGFTRCG